MFGVFRSRRGWRPPVRLVGPDFVSALDDDQLKYGGHYAGQHVWEVALQPAELAGLLNGTLSLYAGDLPRSVTLCFVVAPPDRGAPVTSSTGPRP